MAAKTTPESPTETTSPIERAKTGYLVCVLRNASILFLVKYLLFQRVLLAMTNYLKAEIFFFFFAVHKGTLPVAKAWSLFVRA